MTEMDATNAYLQDRYCPAFNAEPPRLSMKTGQIMCYRTGQIMYSQQSTQIALTRQGGIRRIPPL